MKKIFLILLLLSITAFSFAQRGVQKTSTAPYFQKNIKVKDTLGVEKCIILNGDTITNFGTAGPESDPIFNFEKSLYLLKADTILTIATKTDIANLTPIDTTSLSDRINLKLNIVDTIGFLRTEIDGDVTNEIQDTTEIAGLKEFVESYSINSFTETDPIWKADTTNVPRLETANTFTKANTFNSSILLPNAVATTTAPSILVLENNVVKKDVLIDINESTIEKISTDTLTANFPITFGGLTSFIGVQVLVDDGSIVLPSGVAGFGTIQIGDNQEYAKFTFSTTGVVTLLENSSNVVDTDTDAKLCIFDSGSTVTIRNRLGAQLKLRYTIYYSIN